jgi:hypothetical protein
MQMQGLLSAASAESVHLSSSKEDLENRNKCLEEMLQEEQRVRQQAVSELEEVRMQ